MVKYGVITYLRTYKAALMRRKGPVIINSGGGTEEKMVGSRKNAG